MGFFSDFLGGKDPQTFQLDLMTPGQRAALDRLIPQLEAPPSGLEATSLQALEQMALSRVGVPGQREPTRTGTPTGDVALESALAGKPQDFEDLFRLSVQEPALREFQETVLPGISRRFAGANEFFGSERRAADVTAQRNLLESLTRTRGELAFGASEAAKNRQLQALGLLPQVDQTTLGIATTAEQLRNERIKRLLAALGLQTKENVVVPGTEGQLGEVIGGALAGFGAYAGAVAASDRRVKINLVPDGELSDGTPVYVYNYIWAPDVRYRGVLADDLLITQPDAVLHAGDFLIVDYNKVRP